MVVGRTLQQVVVEAGRREPQVVAVAGCTRLPVEPRQMRVSPDATTQVGQDLHYHLRCLWPRRLRGESHPTASAWLPTRAILSPHPYAYQLRTIPTEPLIAEVSDGYVVQMARVVVVWEKGSRMAPVAQRG